MTKIRVEIEFKGPYDDDDENKSWLCDENIRLVLIENTCLTFDTIKVREIEEGV